MVTSEMEYHLISWLISTPDRLLAQKVDLLIWYNSSVPQPLVMKDLIEIVQFSKCEDDMATNIAKYVNDSGMQFQIGEDIVNRAMPEGHGQVSGDVMWIEKNQDSVPRRVISEFPMEAYERSEYQEGLGIWADNWLKHPPPQPETGPRIE